VRTDCDSRGPVETGPVLSSQREIFPHQVRRLSIFSILQIALDLSAIDEMRAEDTEYLSRWIV
jgi:hypothetical protein